MLGLQIHAPGNFVVELVVVFFQKFHCLGIGDTGKIIVHHVVQAVEQSLVYEGIKKVHLFRCVLQYITDHIF